MSEFKVWNEKTKESVTVWAECYEEAEAQVVGAKNWDWSHVRSACVDDE